MILTLVLLLIGLIWKYYPPKKINSLYGYRTAMSMKNEDTWRFANNYAAMWMVRVYAFLFMVAIFLFSWPLPFKQIEGIMLAPVLLGLVLIIVRTESYLNTLFDKDGRRKQA